MSTTKSLYYGFLVLLLLLCSNTVSPTAANRDAGVRDRDLTTEQAFDRHNTRKSEFVTIESVIPEGGPYIHFERRGEIIAYWQTETAVASVLEYGHDLNLGMAVRDSRPKKEHSIRLSVRPQTTYYYRIIVGKAATKTFRFYSAFDYGTERIPDNVAPYPVDEMTPVYQRAAGFIVSTYGSTKGLCVDYGCGMGRLAFEISKRSNLKVIGFESDLKKVVRAREILDDAGLYGTNIVIHHADLDNLGCRDYLANLLVSDRIISDGTCPGSADEMLRILRPAGGVAVLGRPDNCPVSVKRPALLQWLGNVKHSLDVDSGLWAIIRREALGGAGTWDHFYANPANTTNSGDTLITSNLQLLWYGQPGPRYITDRHNRPMSSLFKSGIMLTPGHDRLMAYDAYNGTRYWDVAIPDATRVAVLRDCGWVSLADDLAYVAHRGNCVALDLRTGVPKTHFAVPQLVAGQIRHWGLVANQADRLYGTGQKRAASIIGQDRPKIMAFGYGNKRPFATSDFIFCMDRHTGQVRWTYRYRTGSAIINPTIALSDEAVFFLESRNPQAVRHSTGRINADVLLADNHEYLVKLNGTTGEILWQIPLQLPFEHIMYVLFSPKHNLVIAVGTKDVGPKVRYDQLAFNADDGSAKWATNFGGAADIGGIHGEQEQHPCIVGDTMYLRYYKVDMSDGTASAFAHARSGCGTESACTNFLFGRNNNPYMYSLPTRAGVPLSNDTRPGCWVNIYPVGGLVMIPESSSGCTCNHPLQTTMVFQPIQQTP
ncbi:MAG: methyltransferase domain-containing protein [Planctomycetes bacterium]|nr:methyltransferase domain-containing protein [Planctomycetota bacterium]